MSEVGYLHVYIGSMFSGKTSALIKQITHFADLAKISGTAPPLLINSSQDIRDQNNVVSSHNSGYKGLSDNVKVLSVKNLSDANIKDYHVIGIDEHHFYPDYATTVLQWKKEGKRIYTAGLVGDSNQNDFGQIHQILPKIDKLEFLTAVCHCCLMEHTKSGKILTPEILKTMEAPYTKRIINSDTQIDVGAGDKYLPSCGKHL